jgi:hypothetical protein
LIGDNGAGLGHKVRSSFEHIFVSYDLTPRVLLARRSIHLYLEIFTSCVVAVTALLSSPRFPRRKGRSGNFFVDRIFPTMANIKSVLFPTTYVCGFTTCPAVILPDITNIQLSDDSLGVHKVAGRTTHDIVTPPTPHSLLGNPPDQAYEAFYPKGGINPGADLPSGFSFYISGPEWFREKAMKAREMSWSYRVMFENGWEGAKGGKLPGVFGGTGEKAYGCSGGRKETRCQCFSLRLMWRSFFCLNLPLMLRTHC